jgi:hypothetical protein
VPGYRPVDLPELRAEMAQWAESPDAAEHWAKVGKNMDSDGEYSPLRGLTAEGLRRAELFFIEPDLAELAAHAAKSLPDLTLEPEDLPAPCGLMYSPEPIFVAGNGTNHILGAAWEPCPVTGGGEFTDADGRTVARQAVWVTYLVERDQYLERVNDLSARASARARLPRLHHLSPRGIWILNHGGNPDDLAETRARGFDTSPAQVIRSAWLLMQQEGLARDTEIGLDRATRKRLTRAGVEEADTRIRVIALRRPSKPAGEAETSERDYHHQWVVRGHWRNQPYKRQDVVRPIWIAPHIKGPEGAPLLGGERVLHWKQ